MSKNNLLTWIKYLLAIILTLTLVGLYLYHITPNYNQIEFYLLLLFLFFNPKLLFFYLFCYNCKSNKQIKNYNIKLFYQIQQNNDSESDQNTDWDDDYYDLLQTTRNGLERKLRFQQNMKDLFIIIFAGIPLAILFIFGVIFYIVPKHFCFLFLRINYVIFKKVTFWTRLRFLLSSLSFLDLCVYVVITLQRLLYKSLWTYIEIITYNGHWSFLMVHLVNIFILFLNNFHVVSYTYAATLLVIFFIAQEFSFKNFIQHYIRLKSKQKEWLTARDTYQKNKHKWLFEHKLNPNDDLETKINFLDAREFNLCTWDTNIVSLDLLFDFYQPYMLMLRSFDWKYVERFYWQDNEGNELSGWYSFSRNEEFRPTEGEIEVFCHHKTLRKKLLDVYINQKDTDEPLPVWKLLFLEGYLKKIKKPSSLETYYLVTLWQELLLRDEEIRYLKIPENLKDIVSIIPDKN